MHAIPKGAPTALFEAFGYVSSIGHPGLEDLKLMVLLEAAGKEMYDALAGDARDPEVARLLRESGDDELVHARRIGEIIAELTGTRYPVPAPGENPYLEGWIKPDLTVALVTALAEAETGGECLYERWASACGNPMVAGLLRQNGGEELAHADRLRRIVRLLAP